MSDQKLSHRVLERAQADEAFRTALLADPRTAIQDAFEVGLTFDVRVIEETPNEVVLVLPATERADELSDEELAAVAGGIYSAVQYSAWADC
jgi:hypothetical protein